MWRSLSPTIVKYWQVFHSSLFSSFLVVWINNRQNTNSVVWSYRDIKNTASIKKGDIDSKAPQRQLIIVHIPIYYSLFSFVCLSVSHSFSLALSLSLCVSFFYSLSFFLSFSKYLSHPPPYFSFRTHSLSAAIFRPLLYLATISSSSTFHLMSIRW